MTAVGCRAARAEDLGGLTALERACFGAAWPEPDLAAALASERTLILVAESGAGLLGYALFVHLGDEAELLRIGVSPDQRGRGVATALLARGLDRLAADGVASIWLEVRPTNRAALELYRRAGFLPAGVRRGYYADGEDALLFRRAAAPRDPVAG